MFFFNFRLTFTPEMGYRIHDHCKCPVPCRCSAQAMAQNVFTHQKMYKDAVVCLLKQGRVKAGIDMAKTRSVERFYGMHASAVYNKYIL